MRTQTLDQRIKGFERKQINISVLCLLFLSGVAVIFNAIHLQTVAEENTRFLSRMVKIGDLREASLILQQARLSSFEVIKYKSKIPDRSFVIPAKAEIFKEEAFLHRITRAEITVPVDLSSTLQSDDEILFVYDRLRLIPYAVLIWLILNLISIPQTRLLKQRLLEQFNHDIETEKKIVKSEIAQQVRHNLRTPLAALQRIPSKLPSVALKERELLELTIGQIRDLISKLDDRPHETLAESLTTDIYETLEQAKRELAAVIPKSIEFSFETEDIVASALVKHVPYELRAVLGNLVNNSIEALDSARKILIRVQDLGAEMSISVSDNGKGIKPENLSKVFERHFSVGKVNGTGIGLSHAKENIEAWGGRISIESTLDIGTTVKILLPIAERAAWYLPRLKFNSASKIVVIDDQESALELWKQKLDEAGVLDQTIFSQNGDCIAKIEISNQADGSAYTFLFDYDLSQSQNGLHILRKLPSKATRCLVTGNFDNQELRRACDREGVFLIPKEQIADLAVVVT